MYNYANGARGRFKTFLAMRARTYVCGMNDQSSGARQLIAIKSLIAAAMLNEWNKAGTEMLMVKYDLVFLCCLYLYLPQYAWLFCVPLWYPFYLFRVYNSNNAESLYCNQITYNGKLKLNALIAQRQSLAGTHCLIMFFNYFV